MNFKKSTNLILILSFLFTMFTNTCITTMASDDINGVYVDTKKITFPSVAQPELINDRTMVYLRSIAESMGYKVDYITQVVTLTKGSTVIELKKDSNYIKINGVSKYTDVAPYEKQVDGLGYTYVPVRFIAEATGCKVVWTDSTNTVYINTNPSTILWPVPDYKYVTQEYAGDHYGFDIVGTKVIAPVDGEIALREDGYLKTYAPGTIKDDEYYKVENNGWGNRIVLIGTDGKRYEFRHLAVNSLTTLTKVKAGDVIATVGNTGESSGAHLHFAIYNGKSTIYYLSKKSYTDPKPYLPSGYIKK